ncbi:hypothetical protein BO99DRAFT_223973 [Aspergillus violaceofuscus CBS 115571]|uniref:Uncharacterized protein n=1 Tax=Aspergillus violaceofuscus (strain CBS 115571) TaxID=1450538 RepID=A0A2V5HFF1_ASPV1|nr:hypothetical protein BO99DRAFT_223973 [Aspergillus violaceofuscus CBS 115571]
MRQRLLSSSESSTIGNGVRSLWHQVNPSSLLTRINRAFIRNSTSRSNPVSDSNKVRSVRSVSEVLVNLLSRGFEAKLAQVDDWNIGLSRQCTAIKKSTDTHSVFRNSLGSFYSFCSFQVLALSWLGLETEWSPGSANWRPGTWMGWSDPIRRLCTRPVSWPGSLRLFCLPSPKD